MISLESCLNKIVHCSDGAYRRLTTITEQQLRYEVPIGKGDWFSMGATPRREVEDRFINGVIVEKML